MKISVIIPTKNEESNLEQLLLSLKKQTFKNFEVIVVDNFSLDKTRQIASKFKSKVFTKGNERSSQRNYGIKKATGDFIFFADADMQLQEVILADSLKKMQSLPNIAGVIIDEISTGEGLLAKVKRLEKQLNKGHQELEAARFFRKQDLLSIGGFDEGLVSGEDWDLTQRIKKIGQLARITSKIYHHEQNSWLDDIRKKYYYAKYINRYAVKHPQHFQKQAGFTRFLILFKKPRIIVENPSDFLMLLVLKSIQYLAFLLAKVNF